MGGSVSHIIGKTFRTGLNDIFGASRETDPTKAARDATAAAASYTPPAPTPLPDTEAIAQAQRRKAARKATTGRASTVFSDNAYGSDTLGGG